jgi:hypothetical protein
MRCVHHRSLRYSNLRRSAHRSNIHASPIIREDGLRLAPEWPLRQHCAERLPQAIELFGQLPKVLWRCRGELHHAPTEMNTTLSAANLERIDAPVELDFTQVMFMLARAKADFKIMGGRYLRFTGSFQGIGMCQGSRVGFVEVLPFEGHHLRGGSHL